MRLVLPTVSQSFLFRTMRILNFYFIGKVGNVAMTAGVGLAISIIVGAVQWILIGANCAQETLTS